MHWLLLLAERKKDPVASFSFPSLASQSYKQLSLHTNKLVPLTQGEHAHWLDALSSTVISSCHSLCVNRLPNRLAWGQGTANQRTAGLLLNPMAPNSSPYSCAAPLAQLPFALAEWKCVAMRSGREGGERGEKERERSFAEWGARESQQKTASARRHALTPISWAAKGYFLVLFSLW